MGPHFTHETITQPDGTSILRMTINRPNGTSKSADIKINASAMADSEEAFRTLQMLAESADEAGESEVAP